MQNARAGFFINRGALPGDVAVCAACGEFGYAEAAASLRRHRAGLLVVVDVFSVDVGGLGNECRASLAAGGALLEFIQLEFYTQKAIRIESGHGGEGCCAYLTVVCRRIPCWRGEGRVGTVRTSRAASG